MPTQKEMDAVYMTVAEAHASLSKAERKKVGAAIVTPDGNIIPGVNGLPSRLGNVCEDVEWVYYDDKGNSIDPTPNLVTKKEVIHAELNCILKAAKQGISIKGSTLYVTLSPCVPCASMILSAGIEEVVFKERYRDCAGEILLSKYITVRMMEG